MGNKSWYEDDEGWDARSVEDCCLECGDRQFRESRVPGVCVACMNGDSDIDLGYLWEDAEDDVSE